jgi:hypothetical protein
MANSVFARGLEEMTPERRKEIEGRAINTYGEQPQVDMAGNARTYKGIAQAPQK